MTQNPEHRWGEGTPFRSSRQVPVLEFKFAIHFSVMFCVNHTPQARISQSKTESGNQKEAAQTGLKNMP